MALYPHLLIDDIVAQASGKKICVAYSGGVDSHVLLHLLAQTNNHNLASVSAMYIDHGLNDDSSLWAQHCATVCAELQVDFKAIKVDVKGIDSLGMEAAARQARYQAFEQYLTQDDCLLTAQHQQDQAETLLLQLLRGAGPKGLSAMAKNFALGQLHVYRPLINCKQADVLSYANEHNLKWIEDPSNQDTRWNRNYIRHELWPNIIKRWPSAAKTLSRSAEHCAEATELLDEIAQQDLYFLNLHADSESIVISELLTLSSARRNNLLRHFFSIKKLAMPSAINLQRIIDEICLAKQDSEPLVEWKGVQIRRYQDSLYSMTTLSSHDVDKVIQLNSDESIEMADDMQLVWLHNIGKGINKSLLNSRLSLRYRQGGERIKPQGSNHHSSLKHLFQRWLVPPWQRQRIPLIFCEDRLIAVVGYCISDDVAVDESTEGYLPVIKSR